MSGCGVGLSGLLRVDVTDSSAATAFTRAIDEIRQAGWRITMIDLEAAGSCENANIAAGSGSDIIVLKENGRATVVAGRGRSGEEPLAVEAARLTREQVDPCLTDTMPTGFSILCALGGGRIERVLAESVVAETPVDRVIVGLNWTLVRAGDLCGVSRSPARGTEGGRTVRGAQGFRGKPLSELARMLLSLDPLARSIGLAAANAFWSRSATVADGSSSSRISDDSNMVGFARFSPPGDGLVVVGAFPDVRQRLPHARIVEREPGPHDIPASDADGALATAQQVAMTAQTLMNASLERLLALSAGATTRMLIGPSAPLCPLLLQCGLTDISGFVIVDPVKAEEFVCETGTRILVGGMTRPIALKS